MYPQKAHCIPITVGLDVFHKFFIDREDAGQQLAQQLTHYANRNDVVVLGIPRGGVPVAFQVARQLNAPLDVFLSRKLGVPGQEELAFGALAAGYGRYLDEDIVRAAGVSADEINRITELTAAVIEERACQYRESRPPLQVEDKTVILVDDGIATGASVYAALRALRQAKPKKLVLAAPVAPVSIDKRLGSAADEFVITHQPRNFYAVGQFYQHFDQTSDEEVMHLLHLADHSAALK
jgi:putative phosphoribosyl transferase